MKAKLARPSPEKRALVVRLRRIKGQVEALERMMEADAAPSDILMQVVATRRALKSFSEEIIAAQLRAYVENTARRSAGQHELNSLLAVLKRYTV